MAHEQKELKAHLTVEIGSTVFGKKPGCLSTNPICILSDVSSGRQGQYAVWGEVTLLTPSRAVG